MSRIAVFFATGYEEIEALTVVDFCRRCGIGVDMVSVTGEKQVEGSHHIKVETDCLLEQLDFDSCDMIVLPGGLAGTKGLEACAPLMEQVDRFHASGKYIAAICAAPSIFGHRGILRGKTACSYPDFESHLEGANVTMGPAEISDNVITSCGMGTSIDFAMAITAALCGREKALEIAKKIVYFR